MSPVSSSPETRRLPTLVVVLAWVSFFNDAASDMAIPLMPLLFAGSYGGGALALGLMEGMADTVSSVMRLWAGRLSDRGGHRRERLVWAGYVLSNMVRPALALAGSWVPAVLLRSLDRVGKGLRSAPRDALLADATDNALRARAFGFQRALDNAGAMTGALVAAVVLMTEHLSVQQIILLSAVPGLLATMVVLAGVRDRRGQKPHSPTSRTSGQNALAGWRELPSLAHRYLGILLLFSFARVPETFIVLRGHEMGIEASLLMLLWAALSFSKSLGSHWGGVLADRFLRFHVLCVSWGGMGLGLLGLAAVSGTGSLWAVTIGYGVFAGLGEGIERALMGDLAHDGLRGTAYGWYNMTLGLAAVPAGVFFGGLWTWGSGPLCFLVCGGLALLNTLLLRRLSRTALREGKACRF